MTIDQHGRLLEQEARLKALRGEYAAILDGGALYDAVVSVHCALQAVLRFPEAHRDDWMSESWIDELIKKAKGLK